jgi:hypothetical protein
MPTRKNKKVKEKCKTRKRNVGFGDLTRVEDGL